MNKHRAAGPAVTRSHAPGFMPMHCAGTTCLHDHVDDDRPSLGWFAPVFRAFRPVL